MDFFFFSSRRRHTRCGRDWSSDVCSSDLDGQGDTLVRDAKPLRNHGLFSKAERALEIAGWSERARNDIEIFRLVDTEGLTPLLMVLNETRTGGGASAPQNAPVT